MMCQVIRYITGSSAPGAERPMQVIGLPRDHPLAIYAMLVLLFGEKR